MSKAQRDKGKRAERKVAALLRELYPQAYRTISQARGAEDCDVGGTEWHVEVKSGVKPAPLAALRQAERDTDGRPALVVCCEDRRGVTVTLRWEDFARVVSEGQRAREIAVTLARGSTITVAKEADDAR
jgi:hypothetical protein